MSRAVFPFSLRAPPARGKSRLARQIFELKKSKRLVKGSFVEVNCGTIRGDAAMSALFGHTKGAFTGAIQARPGLLRAAHEGVLFLDEIGDLGLNEQTMLLRALEDKTFLPVGSDTEVQSDFQLLAGTNRDLVADVGAGGFREDLLARIDLWTFDLPGLRKRPEDIEPNLDYELDQLADATGSCVRFNREARELFLNFATSPAAEWRRNFRDLNGAILRMATLSRTGRIGVDVVREEIARLRRAWDVAGYPTPPGLIDTILGPERSARMDLFDRVQLEEVLRVCRDSRTLAEAGRRLFAVSREQKRSRNDSHRVRSYLARFGIDWADVQASPGLANGTISGSQGRPNRLTEDPCA